MFQRGIPRADIRRGKEAVYRFSGCVIIPNGLAPRIAVMEAGGGVAAFEFS